MTLAFRETVSCILFMLGLRVRCLVSEEMSSRTYNLSISYMMVSWQNGSKEYKNKNIVHK